MTALLGTNVSSPIVPQTSEDNYPTHYAEHGKGGWRSVATVAQMQAIPAERRTKGMCVRVTDDPTPANNAEWEWDGAAWIVAPLRQRVEDLEGRATTAEADIDLLESGVKTAREEARAAKSIASVRKRPRGQDRQDGLVVGVSGTQMHFAATRKIPRPQGGYADPLFVTLGDTLLPSVRMKSRPRSQSYASALVLVCGTSVVGVVDATEVRLDLLDTKITDATEAVVDLDARLDASSTALEEVRATSSTALEEARAAKSVASVRKRPRGQERQDGLVVGVSGSQMHFAATRKIPRPQGGYADPLFVMLGDTLLPSVRMKNRPRSRLYASALVLVCGLSVLGVVEPTDARIRTVESEIAAVNARIDTLDGEGQSEPVAQSVQNPKWLAESVVVGGESQIMVHDGTAYRQITPAGSNWRAPVVSTLNIVRALRDNGGVYPYSLLPNGLQLRESSALLHKVVTGQSLSVGSHGVVLTDEANSDFPFYDGYARLFTKSVPPEYQDYCLSLSGGPRPSNWSSSTAFVPIHEYFDTASKRGETIASSWSVAFRKWSVRNTHIDPRLLVTISGNGGKAYVDLKKGTQVYTDLISHVSKANEIAISMGLTHIVHSIALIHGESQIGTTQAEYEGMLDEWVSDIQTDTMAITGQTVAPMAFLSQMLTGEAGTIPAIPLAQLKASEDNPNISMIGPKYQFPYYDIYHLLAEGYVKLGELEARAERFWMGGQKWQPLKPVSVGVVDNVVTITYNNMPDGNSETPGPVGKLVIDRKTITDPGGAGFAVSGVDIVNVELGTDGRSVILTLSAIPAPGATLSYALQGNLGSPQQGNGRRGNIRDSDCRDQSRYDNAFLYNWSVAFSHAI
ncbi:hypothetical protein [Azotobacter salinestris]|uniref:hypothetical protein n=1 Tax=Azotobacter salinestris TaxID=69964 RepID=UPI0032DE7056